MATKNRRSPKRFFVVVVKQQDSDKNDKTLCVPFPLRESL
jgi:hypothetical protein